MIAFVFDHNNIRPAVRVDIARYQIAVSAVFYSRLVAKLLFQVVGDVLAFGWGDKRELFAIK